jgi:serine/threonine-protein kinase
MSLDRSVALKIVSVETRVDPEGLLRFRSEAEAAARLQHPNIVQVYEVGEQSGLPYFAQEFVNGGSLAQKLGGTPLPAGQAALILHTLARAMDFAHERGIVHRDLKPANVLLTADGVPKVADFGLAKRLDKEFGQTRLGVILGTPSYMAPEQAEGRTQQISPLTDVYALGALLYEMLTGRPPFRGATTLETVQQVLFNEVVTPTRLQPKVPRDLETICLKCLRKEPSNRYASAGMLADDLRRFLEHRPITARRIGWWERAGKWARRQPAAAALILVSGLAAATLAIGGYRYQRDLERHNQELQKANLAISRERDTVAQQRDRADSNLRLARDAVDKTVTKIASNPLLKQANFHQLRHGLLESMVPFYEQFVKQRQHDSELEAERGRALASLAYLRNEMGEKEKASSDYEQLRAIFAQLTAGYPAVGQYRLELARSHDELGLLLRQLGKRADAETTLREALKIMTLLAQDFPAVPLYRQKLAASHVDLANLLRELGKQGDAETAFRDALKIQAQLAQDFPTVAQYRGDLAGSQNNLGLLLSDLGKWGEAENAYRDALKIQSLLAQELTAQPECRLELAKTQNNLGLLLRALGKGAEAEAAFREAVNTQAHLAQDLPDVPEYRFGLARTQCNLGLLLRDLGKWAEEEKAYRDAVKSQAQLAQDFPAVPQYRSELATIWAAS